MLFKPDLNSTAKAAGDSVARIASRARRRTVSITITLLIAVGLSYIAWTYFQQGRTEANRTRPDLAVPVLAATSHIQDVPVYLDGVGTVRALNTVTVRAQVDGKLLSVNFKEGQDVKAGDILAEIDPAIYQAQYDQAVAKKAQDEALLANARIDLVRYQQLAASKAGSTQQADTQRSLVAQYEAQIKSDQAAIDNTQATLNYTKVVAPLAGRTGLRQVDQGNIVHASDATGLVVITQLQPITVSFSLPQQQIVRVNAATALGKLSVDVFGNDGRTVVDTGTLQSIDNQVDPTTGTVKLKAEFPNSQLQLWPGQFVNVRLKVATLSQVLVVPTAAVQRGPSGTFSYVIGADNIVVARPVTVTQQSEDSAVIASGLTIGDRVVTTGFANLADGIKVVVGSEDQNVTPDLAPRRRQGGQGQKQSERSGEQKGAKLRGGQDTEKGPNTGSEPRSNPDQGGQTGGAKARP